MGPIVVVTGAGGYVGQNLVRLLLDAGHTVRAVDRARPAHADGRAQWCEADVLDPGQVKGALDGADLVFHLAARITLAQDDDLAWRVNTEGVRNVAEAALAGGVRRMVHTSSMAAFDLWNCGGTLVEDSPRPDARVGLPVYSRSKLAGEREFLAVVEQGLDGVICHPTSLLGPVDDGPEMSRINAVVLASARGRIPVLIGGGLDMVDVRDVAAGLVLAADKGRTGEGYFLGGEYADMIDVFRFGARLVGRHGPRFTVPMQLVRAIAPLITALSKRDDHPLAGHSLDTIELSPRVDSGKARAELGYAPRPLETTVRDLVAWLVTEGHLRGTRTSPGRGGTTT